MTLLLRSALALLLGATLGFALAPPAIAQDEERATIPIPDADSVDISGGGHLVLVPGVNSQIVVATPPGVFESLRINADDDSLEISLSESSTIAPEVARQIRYEVTSSAISGIELSDDVSGEATGLRGEEVEIDLDDRATFTVDQLEANRLEVDLDGESQLTISGTATAQEVVVRGSTVYDASGLVSATAEIEAQDSAQAKLNVSDSLAASASDDASIEFLDGNVQVESTTRGNGAITAVTAFSTASPVASGSPAAATPLPVATTAEVSIQDFAFDPPTLTVTVGTTVTWTNNDSAPHTATADDDAFDSGRLDTGASFSFTFETPGTFAYHCDFHSSMTAEIVVTE